MLTAIEIEAELGGRSPQHEHAPRHSDLLVKAIAELQSKSRSVGPDVRASLSRRPGRIEELEACFVVRDHGGQT